MAQIDILFQKLIDLGGSDLHLREGDKPKIRVHGELEEIKEFAVLDNATITAMLEEIVPKQAYWDDFVKMGDIDFAAACNSRLESGRKSIVENLFNGEYFIHKPNSDYPESMDLTEGSYIDQVFGQGYAMQLGLELC